MKRKGEVTLSIIGSVFGLIGLVLLAAFNSLLKLEDFRSEFIASFDAEIDAEGLGDEISAVDFLNGIDQFMSILIASAGIALVVGIVAAILFRNNKKPLLASIILIVASVLVFIGSIGTGIISAALFLIAGLMGLIRKNPKVDELQDIYHTNDTDESSQSELINDNNNS